MWLLYNKQIKVKMSVGIRLAQMLEIFEQPNSSNEIELFAQKNLELDRNYFGKIDRKFLHQLLLKAKSTAEKQNGQDSNGVEKSQKSQEQYWHPNELKSFIWVSVCSAFIEGKALNLEFHPVIHLLFPLKTDNFLCYNLTQLQVKGRAKQQIWGSEEEEVLTKIISQSPAIRWSKFALDLFRRSNGRFFRTSVQCRQKWTNHLDPNVIKGKWTLEDDYELISIALKTGTKWSEISKKFGGCRTEHMVKNRYNAILKRYKPKKFYKPIEVLLEMIQKSIKRKIVNQSNRAQKKQGAQDTSPSLVLSAAITAEQRNILQETLLPLEGIISMEILEPLSANLLCEEGKEVELIEQWEDDYYREDNWLEEEERFDLNYLKGRILMCDFEQLMPTNFD